MHLNRPYRDAMLHTSLYGTASSLLYCGLVPGDVCLWVWVMLCAWMQQATATFCQRLHHALPLLHDLGSMQGVYLVDHQCARPCTQPGPPLHSRLMWDWPACAHQHRLLGVDAGRCAQPDRRIQTCIMSTSCRHLGDLLLPICGAYAEYAAEYRDMRCSGRSHVCKMLAMTANTS